MADVMSSRDEAGDFWGRVLEFEDDGQGRAGGWAHRRAVLYRAQVGAEEVSVPEAMRSHLVAKRVM